MPEVKQTGLSPEVAAEVEALLCVEPRVRFDATPRRATIRRSDIWLMRALVVLGVAAGIGLFFFLVAIAEPGTFWLYLPLVLVFGFLILLSIYEWYCYLGVTPKTAPPPNAEPLTVDVLTTWCPGEPKEMVVATLRSIQRMDYPHVTHLCDEGDDPALREVCERLGVRHVTRVEKIGAKAGNINNALRSAMGDIAVIMDPDHEAAPYFLDRVLGYFDDPEVCFVQHVQAYYNQDESLIARGAAEQTYHFYGPLQTGMHGHGTAQAIGANCAFRRKALDSIGGHAAGLAEDMATTLKLYAKGWTSVYSPEILTRGQVPGTFAGYGKQQLKWACGVWDILIESYPAAFSGINWKNRLHYVMNGLFYCRGLFFLLGGLIPIAALVTGLTPLEITFEQFLIWFGPYFAAQILVRQAAQRWLLEPEERGFHLIGGFLMNAVWLIHLRGVASALMRVKIPYIPTPKEDEAADAWALNAPNFALIAVSLTAIFYGLTWDWSPFSFVMSAFAAANVLSLGVISVAAQQKTLAALRTGGPLKSLAAAMNCAGRTVTDGLCWVLRHTALPLAVAILALLSYTLWPNETETQLETLWAEMEGRTEKDTGGFLLGTYFPSVERSAYGQLPPAQTMNEVEAFETSLGQDVPVVSLFYTWADMWPSDDLFRTLDAISARGSVPMVTWMPTLRGFEAARTDPRYYNEERVFELILSGRFDDFLDSQAQRFRDHGGPVLLRFAHEMDNPQYPWTQVGGNTPEDFIGAWQYVVQRFDAQGATNVSWVWSPWNEATLQAYYPGSHYVDFIGLTVLNYGTSQGFGQWLSFDDLYDPFHARLQGYPAPVLIAEFGSTGLGGDRTAWLHDALRSIEDRPEIAGAVLFNSDEDANWPASWDAAETRFPIEWSMADEASALSDAFTRFASARPSLPLRPPPAPIADTTPRGVALVEGSWQLLADGEPFPMRGVAYDVGSGWRSGSYATRHQTETDFAAIAAMGANTIRRYDIGWQDTNVLRAAEAHGLKVMMGVWLDPGIDYVTDTAALARIEDNLREALQRWHDHPSVLAWNIGNETWGLLKHSHTGPALARQRAAYLSFVERLARLVREIDRDTPVMSSFEFSMEFPGALAQIRRLAPSVDAIGVNAYYYRHLQYLDLIIDAFAPERPVFLSEFGPPGYWDAMESRWSPDGFPQEATDAEKAWFYENVWRDFVDGQPHSIGGVAFTFRDRLEGSPTWFGLTDDEGRRKPAYFALASLWRNEPVHPPSGLPFGLSVTLPDRLSAGARVTPLLQGADWGASCDLEWQLVDEMTLETLWRRQADGCSPEAAGAIDLPSEEGRYRLIARVTVGDAVTTASHPFLVSPDADRTTRLE